MTPFSTRLYFVRGVASIASAFLLAISASAATFSGTGAGPIPDGGQSTPSPGLPLNVTFVVSGMNAPLTDIRVSMTFGTTHPWGGDITATLVSPNGVSFPLFGRIGATSAAGVGYSADLAGTYTFVDPAISTNNIWTASAAAAASGAGSAILQGTYGATPVGGLGVSNPPALTGLLAAFSALTPAQINGTWTLQMTDVTTNDTGALSAASLTLEDAAPVLQYSYAPYFIHFPMLPVNTQSPAYPVVIFAPATNNAQNVGFPANACVMSGANASDFLRLPDPVSIAAGATGQLLVQFRPSGNGNRSATMTCTAQPSGVTPAQIIVQLDGAGGDPQPAPNCYDVDGDGVMNPLVDGLFITRLQLGLKGAAAVHDIAFNAPRDTAKKVLGFMVERCGLAFPSTP